MTHPLYVAWFNMKQRCDNPKRDDYQYYGAVGVTYTPEWADAATFMRDMRQGWARGKVLDREDRTKPYGKDNCRWVDWSESNYNRKMFATNTSRITGVGLYQDGYRARAGKNGALILYQGKNFFEACCARKSWENRR